MYTHVPTSGTGIRVVDGRLDLPTVWKNGRDEACAVILKSGLFTPPPTEGRPTINPAEAFFKSLEMNRLSMERGAHISLLQPEGTSYGTSDKDREQDKEPPGNDMHTNNEHKHNDCFIGT